MIPRSILTLAFVLAGGSTLARAQSDLRVTGLPDDAPLVVRASATERALLVDLEFEPEWHAYARDVGGGRPVGITLEEGGDFEATGALSAPGGAQGQLAGTVRLTLPIAPRGGGRDLRATFDVQVCDALMCLAPMSLAIAGEVESLSVLLVVEEPGERANRIVGGLRERGLEVTLATYADVSLEACDARDVVIADSLRFGQFADAGATIGLARGFPRTTTPIVAVGFLGTELVAAHGIAMTSGYI